MKSEHEKELERKTTIEKDPVYRFFSDEIGKTNSQIWQNKYSLKQMIQRQIELKRGKSALVKARQEYINSKYPKKNKEQTK